MTKSHKQILLFIVFLLAYGVIFYLLWSLQVRHDFPSFYRAAIAYFKGLNPYEVLIADFLPTPGKIPANLNPPFFLELIQPFTWIDYHQALAIWSLLLFSCGLTGAFLVFKIIFPEDYLKKNWLTLLLVYLALYSTIMSTVIVQMGAVLFLFVMAGYYFYIKGRDDLAGIFWGIIIAIKLFPALLFFLALSQKRYKVILVMLATCVIASAIPLLSHGMGIYSIYFKMLPRILWFGDSWNASFYGFLFRIFIDIDDRNQSLVLIKTAYAILFMLSLLWYLRTIYIARQQASNHAAFCLTLAMMLFMSPFGWMYYFSLLLMPLIITWQNLDAKKTAFHKESVLWLCCLFLINFPLSYIRVKEMTNIVFAISICSLHFYGLLILIYLLARCIKQANPGVNNANATQEYLFYPVISILAFGFIAAMSGFLLYLACNG